jgi:hypothetical protein
MIHAYSGIHAASGAVAICWISWCATLAAAWRKLTAIGDGSVCWQLETAPLDIRPAGRSRHARRQPAWFCGGCGWAQAVR